MKFMFVQQQQKKENCRMKEAIVGKQIRRKFKVVFVQVPLLRSESFLNIFRKKSLRPLCGTFNLAISLLRHL